MEGLEVCSKLFKVNSVGGEDSFHIANKDFETKLKLKPLQIRKLRRYMERYITVTTITAWIAAAEEHVAIIPENIPLAIMRWTNEAIRLHAIT